MNARDASRALVSGTVVYVVMASCSPSAGSGPVATVNGDASIGASGTPGASAGGASSTGGARAGASGAQPAGRASVLDAAIDHLTNPVAPARAEVTQSGTRLHAKYLAGADGSKQFNYAWRDTQLNVDCIFQTASDGKTRCLPSAGAATGPYFSDSGCTQPVAYAAKSTCGAASGYASTMTLGGCPYGYTYRVFPVGAAIPTTSVYQGSAAACSAVPATTGTTFDFYSLGAEVAPTQFVAAVEQMD